MKIIKEGLPEKKFIETKITRQCKNCGCEYEFTGKDSYYVGSSGNCSVYGVKCPWCNDFYHFHW